MVLGDNMVNRNSEYYLKSTYEQAFYGDEKTTIYERKLEVGGNDKDRVKDAAGDVKSRVMP